jgi:hypothetical protein
VAGQDVRGLQALEGRWISDEPFPGWVEVDFVDADGRRWTVADKPSVFSRHIWTAETGPPADLAIDCYVENAVDREAVVRLAWGLETTTGEATFRVPLSDLSTR